MNWLVGLNLARIFNIQRVKSKRITIKVIACLLINQPAVRKWKAYRIFIVFYLFVVWLIVFPFKTIEDVYGPLYRQPSPPTQCGMKEFSETGVGGMCVGLFIVLS
jgi:hypothetical protein